MLLSTSDEIAGREITETIGLVSGNADARATSDATCWLG